MKRSVGRTQRVMLVAAASGTLAFAASKVASACSPYGLIGDKWNAIGGNSSYEGPCLDDEHDDGVGNGGRIEMFQNGHIEWFPGQGAAYAVHGLIDSSWMSRGGPPGYGQAVSDESGVYYCQSCRMSTFYVQSVNMNTYLVYNPGVGQQGCDVRGDHVCAVYGDIGKLWYEDNFFAQDMVGAPVDEEAWWNGFYRLQHFQNVYMIWNSRTLNRCAYWNDGSLLNGDDPSACTGAA